MSRTLPSPQRLRQIAHRIRRNVIEICRQRGGYAGQGVALADLVACLYFHELRPDGSGWFHDRFVLSNGHDAIACYGALEVHGAYTMEALRSYNADGTAVDMSPIEGQLGFEITAGSLGQGPSQAAGIAYGERLRGSDRRVYCLLSDGELQEGNVWEAAMFAAHHRLDNLVWLIDNNDLQASGATSRVLGVEPVPQKLAAFGFEAQRVDGQSVEAILAAFAHARRTTGRPFAMVCDTRLFHGIPVLQQSYAQAHYMDVPDAVWQRALDALDAQSLPDEG